MPPPGLIGLNPTVVEVEVVLNWGFDNLNTHPLDINWENIEIETDLKSSHTLLGYLKIQTLRNEKN